MKTGKIVEFFDLWDGTGNPKELLASGCVSDGDFLYFFEVQDEDPVNPHVLVLETYILI